jgi:C-terminal processing protease CtpA/Prc
MLYLVLVTPLTTKVLTLKTLFILCVGLFLQNAAFSQAINDNVTPIEGIAYNIQATNQQTPYVGIGTTLQKDNETHWLYVKDVLTFGPAAQAGIQAGDYITRINGKAVFPMNLREAATHLTGEAGSTVFLTIMRNHQFFSVELTRAAVTF